MSTDEIMAKLCAAGFRAELVDGKPYIVVDAGDADPDVEEQHDLVWRCLCETQDELKAIGLNMPGPETDNDSVFGFVVAL